MKNIKFLSIIAVIIALVFFCYLTHSYGENKLGATKTSVIKIANQELKRLGYNSFFMKVVSVEKCSKDSGCQQSFEWQDNEGIKSKLKGKDFWAVGYNSIFPILGRSAWVFVDADTEKIITSIKGK